MPFPLIVFTEDGNRRDAVVPVFVRVFGKSEAVEVEDVVIDHAADAAEVRVIEDAQASPTEYADGTDPVVESHGHGGPALAILQAEVVPPETRLSIEACTASWLMGPAPTLLGKCG
jgi:hypothetical protein